MARENVIVKLILADINSQIRDGSLPLHLLEAPCDIREIRTTRSVFITFSEPQWTAFTNVQQHDVLNMRNVLVHSIPQRPDLVWDEDTLSRIARREHRVPTYGMRYSTHKDISLSSV